MWYKLGELQNMFTLYPNPSSTYFTIKYNSEFADTDESVKLGVYNALGAKILSKVNKQGEAVDVSVLPVGIYTVKIFNNYNGSEIEQFVKLK